MIEHIVLFRLNRNTTKEQIQVITGALLKMADEIPGILDISAGSNIKNSEDLNRKYNYGLIVRFTNEESLNAYISHPSHQRVVKEYLGSEVVEEVFILDFVREGVTNE